MKRILVPIDFSPTSVNSLKYAQHLSESVGMSLSLLHCYPVREYSRPYDFGKKGYRTGIREMLIDFYKTHLNKDIKAVRLLIKKGSLLDTVALISSQYDIIVLGSKNFGSRLQRWMGCRSSYIASTAKCPVIIKPSSVDYHKWNKIWHINRKENESFIVQRYLKKLAINPELIEVKSLQQSTFKSALWQSVVSYAKAPKAELREKILEANPDEKIDLMILVSHGKDNFQKFLKDDALHIIFQFNIPVLIFQAGISR